LKEGDFMPNRSGCQRSPRRENRREFWKSEICLDMLARQMHGRLIMLRGFAFLLLLFVPVGLYAGVPDNVRALAGLKVAGVIFDVNVANPQTLLLRLKLIEETLAAVAKDGVTPDAVVSIRGGASRFMTRGANYLPAEELPIKDEIQAQVKHLNALGYRLEQCGLALRLLKIEPQDIIAEVPLVGNGYISMIGYQNRGYAFVPMD
jgi:intracellular sulfur oxidation DsrE/DsrF family protein